MTVRRLGVPFPEGFWIRVNKSGPTMPHMTTACWEWMSGKQDGYGTVRVPGVPDRTRAHRLSWEMHNGTIPAGALVLHECDNRGCVRPEHLHLGTYSDNAREREARGRGGLRFGEDNARAKLTNAQRREIAERVASGETFTAIAARFQVDRRTVARCEARGLGRVVVIEEVSNG